MPRASKPDGGKVRIAKSCEERERRSVAQMMCVGDYEMIVLKRRREVDRDLFSASTKISCLPQFKKDEP